MSGRLSRRLQPMWDVMAGGSQTTSLAPSCSCSSLGGAMRTASLPRSVPNRAPPALLALAVIRAQQVIEATLARMMAPRSH
jgi:hypothetical protein